MESTQSKHRAMLAAISSALALGLAACGERPATDRIGQNSTDRSRSPMSADSPTPPLVQPGGPTAGSTVDDASVTAKVKSALTSDPNLKSMTINVETASGVVTLKGTADSQDARQKAEQLASAIEGVRNVKNELVVISG